jgi:hypothetical protein
MTKFKINKQIMILSEQCSIQYRKNGEKYHLNKLKMCL